MKTFACIIPAYNEQEILPLTLTKVFESINNVPGYKGRVIVVNNNSSDQTATIAQKYGAEVVFEPENQISKARNCGGKYCPEVDYLLFLDADTFLTQEILKSSLELFKMLVISPAS